MSIDDWMWRLYGDDLPKTMNLKWIMERVERCEEQIWIISKNILDRNCAVVLDLGFTTSAKRKLFNKLARDENIEAQLHYINASHALRRKRVLERNLEKGETFSFEVTPGMFDYMETQYEQPSPKELEGAIIIDTNLD